MTTKNLLIAAALAGAFTGTTLTAHADPAPPPTTETKPKDGKTADKPKADAPKTADKTKDKSSCGGKDGCSGKTKDKSDCGGKDGCGSKKK